MAIKFRLDSNSSLLDWSYQGDAVELTADEAAIVAQAEQAAAMRSIADGLYAIVEEMRENRAKSPD
ncbi:MULTISPECIES: hypothetical protein [unclassified Mesorhizobium]|uniref:hypothetical protein n=1 Tax=unclassified Mesorhizobium TaxID=325217 RepID=UPI00333AB085